MNDTRNRDASWAAHVKLCKKSIKAGVRMQHSLDEARAPAFALAAAVRDTSGPSLLTERETWQQAYEAELTILARESPGLDYDGRVMLAAARAGKKTARRAEKLDTRIAKVARKMLKRAKKAGAPGLGASKQIDPRPRVGGGIPIPVSAKPPVNPTVDSQALQRKISNSDRTRVYTPPGVPLAHARACSMVVTARDSDQSSLEKYRDRFLEKGHSLEDAVLLASDKLARRRVEAARGEVLDAQRDARLAKMGGVL